MSETMAVGPTATQIQYARAAWLRDQLLAERWSLRMIIATLSGIAAFAFLNLVPAVPTAYLPGIQADWEQRATDMGVTVVFTDDDRNCGAHLETGQGGCFDPATPDTIYLSTWLSADTLEAVALHELAHVQQNRDGLPGDECAADAQAIKWGASYGYYDCE